jgi:hypothetical protein
MTLQKTIEDFVRESNRIEGIEREPLAHEIDATNQFMILFQVSWATVGLYQDAIAPGKPLRTEVGMDVRVGNHIAPAGGPKIKKSLEAILERANKGTDPWLIHIEFERLHPYMDGNGRTGRMLWVWQMHGLGRNPFALPFLHRFYYQTLDHVGR